MAAGVTTVVGKIIGHPLAMQGVTTSSPLTDVDTTQRNALGMVVQDDAGNEYIYLQGIASTVAGSWVFMTNATGGYITQLTTTSSPLNGRVAVALAAVLASQFGWYAIKHSFVFGQCISDTLAVNVGVFVTATAGSIDDEGGAGTTVFGAVNRTLGTTTSSNFEICYPFVTGVAPV